MKFRTNLILNNLKESKDQGADTQIGTQTIFLGTAMTS